MAESSNRFIVDRRTEWVVLGPNPGVSIGAYTGEHLLVCTPDNREAAELIAAVLNVYSPAQYWPNLPN